MKRALGAGLMAVAIVLAATEGQAQGAKFQCWTDRHGARACGDRVPPEYAKQERTVLNREGRVVDVLPREKSAEELAEERRQAEAAKAAERAAREAAAYDRFLLDTYTGPRDLERARDERIAMLNGRLRLTQKAVVDDEKALAGLDARIEAQMKEGHIPDKQLRKQQREVQRRLRENRQAIEQIKADRQALQDKFARDIQRFQQLRAEIIDRRAAERQKTHAVSADEGRRR